MAVYNYSWRLLPSFHNGTTGSSERSLKSPNPFVQFLIHLQGNKRCFRAGLLQPRLSTPVLMHGGLIFLLYATSYRMTKIVVVFIDRKAREIIRLVASVCLSVCQSICILHYVHAAEWSIDGLGVPSAKQKHHDI